MGIWGWARPMWAWIAVLTVVVACGGGREATRVSTSERALVAVDAFAAFEPALAAAIAPKRDGLLRAASDASEDAETRGAIVSSGWRAAKEKRFSELGAKLPDRGDGVVRVGASRFRALQVDVTLEGAAPSDVELRAGRAVYRNVFLDTDRVLAGDAASLEEMLVLHTPRAPRAFAWRMQLPEGIARVRPKPEAGGGFLLEDKDGRPKLAISELRARDARGERVTVTTAWDEGRGVLTASLASDALVYPVVVDPQYELSIWTSAASRVPPARTHHALAFDAARGEVLLFGGSGPAGALNDTWVWNGAVAAWTQRIPLTPPPARYGHALAFDAARGEVLLFGGQGTTGTLNDTWAWNGAAAAWTQRSPVTPPPARFLHALAFDAARGEVLLFGGEGTTGSLNDTWAWNGSADAWTQRSPVTPPPARYRHALAFNAARSEALLFGGLGLAGSLDDTWVWNGAAAAWTQRSPATRPPVRFGHALAFDAARGEVLLFGGRGATVTFNDTWAWNGVADAWTQRSPVTPPPARTFHALAFDAARGEVLLFGGLGLAGLLDDTWVWNGAAATWTQRSPATPPPARSGHALAFDAARGEVLLFGGQGTTVTFNDTWAWNGAAAAWTQRSPVTPPPARTFHALAFDAARGEVLLFGGRGAAGALNDTWVWNGAAAAWNQRSPLTAPPTRSGHALAFDAARGEVLLFGGFGFAGALNDTWLHTTLGGTCANDFDCSGSQSFCTDGVCCNVRTCGTCATCASITPGRCVGVTNAEDADTCAVADGKSCDGSSACKTAVGVPAASALDCASGNAVDGVCCNEPCTGACQACRADLKEAGDRTGVCGAAKAGQDPHESCGEDPMASCKKDGLCDGRGACRLRVAGAACGDVSCVGAARSAGQVCDGLGACRISTGGGVECGAYACTPSAGCLASCTTAADCAPLHRCESGACVPDQGARCEGNTAVTTAGDRTECTPYACQAGACPTTCASRLQCTTAYVCSPEHACVPDTFPPPASESGCGVSPQISAGHARGAFGALAALLGVRVLARRRRRARSQAWDHAAATIEAGLVGASEQFRRHDMRVAPSSARTRFTAWSPRPHCHAGCGGRAARVSIAMDQRAVTDASERRRAGLQPRDASSPLFRAADERWPRGPLRGLLLARSVQTALSPKLREGRRGAWRTR